MKTFIKLSWRNIWRNKRRSLVVIFSMALGIFAMIFSIGFMNGMNIQAVENTISTSLGHIAIHSDGFQENMKLQYNFKPDKLIYEKIKKNNSYKAHAPHVKIQGMVRSSEASKGVIIIGIDPEQEKKISKIHDYTMKKNGSEFLTDPMEESILISKEMGKKLDLLAGDRLVLMLQDRENKIVGTGLKVKGFYETPISSFDKYVVYTGINRLQEITGIGDNISEITILLKNKNSVDEVKKSLTGSINNKGLEILSWKDMAPNLVSAIELFDSMMYIFFSIIFITVVFSVANTLIMAIMERFHEIGVMKSIGTRPSMIFFMVIFEALSLGIVGLALGISTALLAIFILSFSGIDLSFYMESMRVYGSGSVIYPVIKILDIVIAVIIITFTTLIASLYPAVKAARIKPLEALHYT